MNRIKCKICETEFVPDINNHYISRGNLEIGIATIVRKEEEQLYDTFDCPQCGCQVVVQKRNRAIRTSFDTDNTNGIVEQMDMDGGEDE